MMLVVAGASRRTPALHDTVTQVGNGSSIAIVNLRAAVGAPENRIDYLWIAAVLVVHPAAITRRCIAAECDIRQGWTGSVVGHTAAGACRIAVESNVG